MGEQGGHEVDPLQPRDYADYVDQVARDFTTIRISAMYEGLNSTGFAGLLTPVGGACEAMRTELLEPLFSMAIDKLIQTGEGVRVAAQKYGLAEAEAREDAERAGRGGGPIAI